MFGHRLPGNSQLTQSANQWSNLGLSPKAMPRRASLHTPRPAPTRPPQLLSPVLDQSHAQSHPMCSSQPTQRQRFSQTRDCECPSLSRDGYRGPSCSRSRPSSPPHPSWCQYEQHLSKTSRCQCCSLPCDQQSSRKSRRCQSCSPTSNRQHSSLLYLYLHTASRICSHRCLSHYHN